MLVTDGQMEEWGFGYGCTDGRVGCWLLVGRWMSGILDMDGQMEEWSVGYGWIDG